MQTGFCFERNIKAALGRKARFHRRVIKCADNEVFAVMTLRTSRELFILLLQSLDHFRPRNIRANLR